MTQHPEPYKLEAWQSGEPNSEVSDHLDGCSECQAYVDRLTEAQKVFLAKRPVDDYVREIRKASEKTSVQKNKPLKWSFLSVAIGAMVAIALGIVWAPSLFNNPIGKKPEILRLKGDLQIAVVLLRGGEQTKHQSDLTVAPGDLLRVELTVPKKMKVTVGILEDGGTWTPLISESEMATGVQYLESSLKIDEKPTAAWLMAGNPANVKEALETKKYNKVTRLRLNSEKKP